MNKLLKKTLLNAKEAKDFLSLAKNPRIINCSFTRPIFDAEKDSIYIEERLPQATFFDVDFVCDQKSPYPHMLPSLEQFKEFMKMLDVSKNDDILIYDDFGILGSARAYWTFLAFGKETVILNGGSKYWKNENYPMELDEEHHKKRGLSDKDLDYKINQKIIKNMSEINKFSKKILENPKTGYIIDARGEDRFLGKVPEPREGIRSGNIPGSNCIPFKKLLNEDFSMKKPEELKKVYEKFDLNKEIYLTCGSGVTASVEFLALRLIGKKDGVSVYDGSWSEYGSIPVE